MGDVGAEEFQLFEAGLRRALGIILLVLGEDALLGEGLELMDEGVQLEVALIVHAEVRLVLFPDDKGLDGSLLDDFPGLHGLVGWFGRLGVRSVRLRVGFV